MSRNWTEVAVAVAGTCMAVGSLLPWSRDIYGGELVSGWTLVGDGTLLYDSFGDSGTGIPSPTAVTLVGVGFLLVVFSAHHIRAGTRLLRDGFAWILLLGAALLAVLPATSLPEFYRDRLLGLWLVSRSGELIVATMVASTLATSLRRSGLPRSADPQAVLIGAFLVWLGAIVCTGTLAHVALNGVDDGGGNLVGGLTGGLVLWVISALILTRNRPGAYAPSTPGWHPDPLRRHQFRYFDGLEWTEVVGDDGEPGSDRPRGPVVLAWIEAALVGSLMLPLDSDRLLVVLVVASVVIGFVLVFSTRARRLDPDGPQRF